MARLIDRIEKLLFGRTAEETAVIKLRWADMVADQAVARALDRAFGGLVDDDDGAATEADADTATEPGKDGAK